MILQFTDGFNVYKGDIHVLNSDNANNNHLYAILKRTEKLERGKKNRFEFI